MQKVLIDTFIVPAEHKTEFLENSEKVQGFLKTLPGFVEGFSYEKISGDGRYNVITAAIWENDEAFDNAKKAVAEEFKRRNFNPQEFSKKLSVQGERAVYKRSSY